MKRLAKIVSFVLVAFQIFLMCICPVLAESEPQYQYVEIANQFNLQLFTAENGSTGKTAIVLMKQFEVGTYYLSFSDVHYDVADIGMSTSVVNPSVATGSDLNLRVQAADLPMVDGLYSFTTDATGNLIFLVCLVDSSEYNALEDQTEILSYVYEIRDIHIYKKIQVGEEIAVDVIGQETITPSSSVQFDLRLLTHPVIVSSDYPKLSDDYSMSILSAFEREYLENNIQKRQFLLYLYNPCGLPIQSLNMTMKSAVDGSSFVVSSSQVVSFNQLVKVAFEIPSYRVETADDQGGVRRYIISNIYRNLDAGYGIDDSLNQISFYDATITCRGSAFTGDWQLNMPNNISSTINIPIYYTYYRTDTSSRGLNYHNQIDSIYFNVPNRYLNGNKITNVELSYRRARIEPVIVTDNVDVASALDAVGSYVKNVNASRNDVHIASVAMNQPIQGQLKPFYGYGLPYHGSNSPNYIEPNKKVSSFPSFYVPDVTDEVRAASSTVDSHELLNALKISPGSSLLLNDKYCVYSPTGEIYSRPFFSEVDDTIVLNTSTINLDARNYGSSHGFLSNWVHFSFLYALNKGTSTDVDLTNLETLICLEERDFNATDKDISQNLLCQDVFGLRQKYQEGVASDCSTFLCRFNVSQYMQQKCNLYYGDTRYVDSCYIAQEDVYLGLKMLSITVEDANHVSVVYPVNSNAIDAAGDITVEISPRQVGQQASNEVLSNLGSGFSDFLSGFTGVLAIAAVILVVLIVFGIIRAIFTLFNFLSKNKGQKQRYRRKK